MPDVISREAALEILEPYLEAIGGCVWRAWDRWTQETFLPAAVAKRSRASLVYDYEVEEAWKTLSTIEGLRVTDDKGFVIICVEERLILRFKKFGKNLRTSGIPTRQQLQFENQQLTIDGLGPMPLLKVGYLLDEFELSIARVAITCSVDNHVVWALDIPRPDAASVVVLETQPSAPRGPIVRSTRPVEREETGEAES